MAGIVITNTTVRAAKNEALPGARQRDVHDAREPGLVLRIGARGVRWQLRFTLSGKATRLDLGDVDEWTVAEAREIASDAQALIRGRIRRPDADWLFQQRVRLGKVEAPATAQQDPRHTLKWKWEDGVREFLAEVARTRKQRTWKDYRDILRTPELARFAGRPVASITLEEMSLAVADVHKRGVERHAEHVASIIRPMWRFMAHINRRIESGVEAKVMAELEAPPRTRGAPRRKKYVPQLLEIGRVLLFARAGVLHPVTSAAMELLIFSVQRVTTVATAGKGEFRRIGATEGLWSMPPSHRKTAESRGDEADHVVPLPAPAWAAVERMLELHDDGVDNNYVFRGARPRRAGGAVGSIAPSGIQHAMQYTGMRTRPHDLRRAFARLGSVRFGWTLAQVKAVLDHNEGRASDDVTVLNYLWSGTDPKWDMMRAWADLVEEAAAEALANDPRLGDPNYFRMIVRVERLAHKTGKRPPVNLERGGPLYVLPEDDGDDDGDPEIGAS